MRHRHPSRRDFVRTGVGAALGATLPLPLESLRALLPSETPVVSITKVRNDRVSFAVEEAIDLLGGIDAAARGAGRVMLKPNLVAGSPTFTTKPEVMRTLARLLQRGGRDVMIGEGSAAEAGFNVVGGETYRTRDREILDGMQQQVFDVLGYTDLARSLHVPLVNLHSGELVDVPLRDGLAYDSLTLHRSLTEVDLLCSVPMMKTHVLASVTLAMKNVIGLFPGTAYCSVRACVHDHAAAAGSPGVAFEILDMVRANRMGLSVVDGTTAMEGDGPTGGSLVDMGVIVAGTSPLATDIVAAHLMGFAVDEVPTLAWARRIGMTPTGLDGIELRGERPEDVRREFRRPNVVGWTSIRDFWGVKELD